MPYKFLDITATPSVRAAQAANGSRQMWEHFKGHRTFDRFTDNEVAFIAERDSFYMATVSESGWPYVQHRGGPPGFVKVLDDKTLGFRRLSRQSAIYQPRQCRRRRSRRTDPGGLSKPRASENSRAHGSARSCRRSRARRAAWRCPAIKRSSSGRLYCVWRRSTGIARSTSRRVTPMADIEVAASALQSAASRELEAENQALRAKLAAHATG